MARASGGIAQSTLVVCCVLSYPACGRKTNASNREGGAMYDVLITGGRVVDGTGNPWVRSDVAVQGDRIAAMGPLTQAEARVRIDAAGKIVAPGFVDAHVHGDLTL